MNINEEFILSLARNQQLLGVVKDFNIPEELKEILVRNQEIFDNFISIIVNLELDALCKTYEEMNKLHENNISLSTFKSFSESLQEKFGIKVFNKYSHLLTEYFNKIATKEGRTDLLINDEEILRHDIWLERIKYAGDKEVLVNLDNLLFDFMITVHNARISEIRKNNEERYHNEEVLRENKRREIENSFLKNFIKQNETFINLFLKDVKEKENKKDSLGLSDKTVFGKEINDFIDKLSRHNGYKSISEVDGYYQGLEEDFNNELKIMYQHNKK